MRKEVIEIAEQCGCSYGTVYRIAKLLKRLPTVEEVKNRNTKRGRPRKYNKEK